MERRMVRAFQRLLERSSGGRGRGRRSRAASGWQRLYIDHVLQADRGADLDFLVGRRGHEVTRESH
jgi:hypothetical protein